jgi:hypothetical protein
VVLEDRLVQVPFRHPVVRILLLGRVSVLDEVQHKNDNCCYQQQVDQATGDKASIKPYQPKQQQHYQNCPQHESYPFILQTCRILCHTGLWDPSCPCVTPHMCCPFRTSSQSNSGARRDLIEAGLGPRVRQHSYKYDFRLEKSGQRADRCKQIAISGLAHRRDFQEW